MNYFKAGKKISKFLDKNKQNTFAKLCKIFNNF